MNIQRHTPVMGNWWAAIAEAGKDFFSAKGGKVIEVPGAPAALNMNIVAILGVAVVAVAVMKKKHIL
jgi:hypothetical protein